MFNKILYSSFTLLFSLMLFGLPISYAKTPITDLSSNNVIHVAQNGDNTDNIDNNDDDDTDWGWIGLIGLAGLLGLRKNDDRK
ncbi:WGxxGxxG family protein [Sporosarcina globispora]|nr:WGxxGxxG family protein [Sporosarcina globispora]